MGGIWSERNCKTEQCVGGKDDGFPRRESDTKGRL